MQIIVFINQAFSDLLESDFSEISEKSDLDKLMLKSLQRDKEKIEKVESWWGAVYKFGELSNDFSPALLAAKKQKLSGSNYILATPVRIQLGLRDSQCYFLEQEQLPSETLLNEFNEYFAPEFRLHVMPNSSQFILESKNDFEFNFDNAYWPPSLVDYTQQLLVSDSRVRKFLSEVQSWTHSKQLPWNGLYLWGNGDSAEKVKTFDSKALRKNNKYAGFSVLSSHSMEYDYKILCVDDFTQQYGTIESLFDTLYDNKSSAVKLIFSDNYLIEKKGIGAVSFFPRIFGAAIRMIFG